MKKIQN